MFDGILINISQMSSKLYVCTVALGASLIGMAVSGNPSVYNPSADFAGREGVWYEIISI